MAIPIRYNIIKVCWDEVYGVWEKEGRKGVGWDWRKRGEVEEEEFKPQHKSSLGKKGGGVREVERERERKREKERDRERERERE